MKNEKFLELMGEIDEELLERARNPKKNNTRKKIWISAIAACLALCITLSVVFGLRKPDGTVTVNGFNIAAAVLPDGEVDEAPFYNYYSQNGGIKEFYKASLAEMIKAEAGENTVYSPANLYMALAMLAEVTDGESREQILTLLGKENIEEAREMAEALWTLSYEPGEKGTTLLANSMWFRNDYTPVLKATTMHTLARSYKVSSYSGRFENEAYVNAMKEWVHEHTNGFLRDLEMDWELDCNTAFVILSTIYFKDGWENIFTETRDMTFYPTEEGEGIVCEFLAMDGAKVTAYGGEKFTAIEKKFAEGGNMLFVLPDRGYTTDDLLRDEEFMRFIAEPAAFGNKSQAARDIRIPKFDFSAEGRIDEKIKNLGITDVFDKDKANFTPLTKLKMPWVDEINQGIRISIDENGCEAAGYVQIEGVDDAEIPKLMKFDRPFIFAVFTEDGIPLFTGIVNNPTLS